MPKAPIDYFVAAKRNDIGGVVAMIASKSRCPLLHRTTAFRYSIISIS